MATKKREKKKVIPKKSNIENNESTSGLSMRRLFSIILFSVFLMVFLIWLMKFTASKLPHSRFLSEDVHKVTIIVIALFAGIIVFGLFRSTAKFTIGNSTITGVAAFVIIFAGTFMSKSDSSEVMEIYGSVSTVGGIPIPQVELWIPGHQTQPNPAKTDNVGNFLFRVFDVLEQETIEITARSADGNFSKKMNVNVDRKTKVMLEVPEYWLSESISKDSKGLLSNSDDVKVTKEKFRLRFSSFNSKLDAEDAQRVLKTSGISAIIWQGKERPKYILCSELTYSYNKARDIQAYYREAYFIRTTIIQDPFVD